MELFGEHFHVGGDNIWVGKNGLLALEHLVLLWVEIENFPRGVCGRC